MILAPGQSTSQVSLGAPAMACVTGSSFHVVFHLSAGYPQSCSDGGSRIPRAAKEQTQCMSTLPVSACTLSVTILLIKASPMAKFRDNMRRNHLMIWRQKGLNSLGTITETVYHTAISSFSFLPNFLRKVISQRTTKRFFLFT